MAGFKKVVDELFLFPFEIVASSLESPSGLKPFKSSVIPCPDCSPATIKVS